MVLGIFLWVDCINGLEQIEINGDDSSASDMDASPANSTKGNDTQSESGKSRLETDNQAPTQENNNNNSVPIIKQSTSKFKQRMLASYDRDPEMCNTTSLDHFGNNQQKWHSRGILKKTSFYSNDSVQITPIEDVSTLDSINCCEDDKLTDDDYEDYLLSNEISKLPTRKSK